ncbi:MAG: FAD-dependent oxidoreductase [Proteobacteria bacterium]|nr:FAD-dependent oxidoreductase [Pseudomonadota bacterium]
MNTDFLVIGAGVIGINIARELKRRFPECSTTVVDKEKQCGCHASGRNSGVLHAGFYYTANSLKAKFSVQGNKALTEYCEERRIPVNKCGKLVVTKDESEFPLIDELLKRGRDNGVVLEEVDEKTAKSLEPRVRTAGRTIYSPTTSSVDPIMVMRHIEQDAIDEGVDFAYNAKYIRREVQKVYTENGVYQAGYVINSAGLYADRIAKDFGFSENYDIVPFKGLYLYSDEPPGTLHTNVYPVPDLRNPFLGVHFTVTADGQAKIGPTAIPAFWREHYHGFDNFDPMELADVAFRELSLMFFSGFDFPKLAWNEIKKYSQSHMVSLASALVDEMKPENYTRWGRPGIRAQLMDIKKRELVMDFVLEGDGQSMHILNAVSPGFTCAIPFSQFVCDQIEQKTH